MKASYGVVVDLFSAGAADLFVRSVALHDWRIAAAILCVFAALTMTAHFIGVWLSRARGVRRSHHSALAL